MKTPTVKILCPTFEKAKENKRKLIRVSLNDLLIYEKEGAITIKEALVQSKGNWLRSCSIRFNFLSLDLIKKAFGISFEQIAECVAKNVLLPLMKQIEKVRKKERKKERK